MKKILPVVCAGLFTMTIAHADNRLFPTDILKQGELDMQFSVDHDTSSTNLNSLGNPGNGSHVFTGESLEIRYGIARHLHIGAALQYASHDVSETNYSNPPAHLVNNSLEGSQNPSIWAKYGFFDDQASPFTLTGELLVSPNTTGKASTYTGMLSAGWKSSDTLKLYSTFIESTTRNANASTTSRINVGAYQDISNDITLIPHVGYARFSGNSYSSSTQYGFGLSSNIQVAHNTYLMPDISHYRNSSQNSNNGLLHLDGAANGLSISLGLYHLF